MNIENNFCTINLSFVLETAFGVDHAKHQDSQHDPNDVHQQLPTNDLVQSNQSKTTAAVVFANDNSVGMNFSIPYNQEPCFQRNGT